MPFLSVESPDNDRIKSVCALVKDRSERAKQGKFTVENPVMLKEALACGLEVKAVFFAERTLNENRPLALLCEQKGAEVITVGDRVMKKLSALEMPQGVCAVVSLSSLPAFSLQKNGRYLVCERLSDPGNLGTIIRTADAMGFSGVVLSRGSVDYTSPKVVRATMGSLFRVPVAAETDLPSFLATCKGLSIPSLAAVLSDTSHPLDTVEEAGGVAVLIGNEAAGLTGETVRLCDKTVYIPMTGKAESLNAAVAASILMWHFRRLS